MADPRILRAAFAAAAVALLTAGCGDPCRSLVDDVAAAEAQLAAATTDAEAVDATVELGRAVQAASAERC